MTFHIFLFWVYLAIGLFSLIILWTTHFSKEIHEIELERGKIDNAEFAIVILLTIALWPLIDICYLYNDIMDYLRR